ncbi:uncharacterized protein FIBRA_01170 [Fibroporia radiculosa]|uniref:AMP-dependent synthetase/ligase domain-containing protein n=1 Tax=Fibroporia radiculosa TaxID=599839 RepID=J4GJH1_9APHY|nr:uncharacterized protein FIBRA_01170 [Fibroporia radiculosa]CCL99155.1 predicted protein [Fibroporia radiculosa]
MSSFNSPVPFPRSSSNYAHQSVEVPGTRKPGQTGHYRATAYPFLSVRSPGAFSVLTEMFDEGFKSGGNGPCFGYRPQVSQTPLKFADHYEWYSWPEVDVRRRAIGSALYTLFQKGVLGGGQLETVGIWSKNNPEWQIIDLALHAYAKVGVGLYDTLGKDSVEYILNHAEISVVFATVDHIPFLLGLAPKIPTFKMIVCMTVLSDDSKLAFSAWGKEKNVQVIDIQELEEMGAAEPVPVVKPTSDQLATICYTSGTTGNPKGALLTHGNLANAAHAQLHGYEVTGERSALSYLPLAHIYERVMALCIMSVGGRIGFSTGDPLRLLEDLQVMKPTFIAAVPRVLNRVYQAAMAASSAPGLKGKLFNYAMEVKLQQLRTTGVRTHALWDRIVFKKVGIAGLSDRILLLTELAGGSCLWWQAAADGMWFRADQRVCNGLPADIAAVRHSRRVSICHHISHGRPLTVLGMLRYGMTENGGTCTHVWPDDPTSSGTVGPPVPCSEIKLLDVPAMNYSAEDKPRPRGEILVRGDNCFIGYYKDEANTKAALDEDGWVHTGDVGEMDECGRLRIIDRVKNIMKLAQGEYVALENIENVYSACPLVAQLFVHGDSLQSYLLAVVVPDPVQFADLVSKLYGKPITPTDVTALEAAVYDPKVNAAVLAELTKQAQAEKLKGFEMIKRIHITMELFTVDNGCLTPTLKIRRKETYAKFKNELDALYELPAPASSKL